MKVIDRAEGIAHFLFDRVPGGLPEVPPRPRKKNYWVEEGKPVVACVNASRGLKGSVQQCLDLLGPVTAAISRGDQVLIKPNFNSDDSPPATTDLEFLRIVVEILLDLGARVTIGESSGGMWRPSVKVFRRVGLDKLAHNLGVQLISFEEKEIQWVRVKIDGDVLTSLVMPRIAYEADKLVYLPCLKTHFLAGYSGALKLPFGFVHPGERLAFHVSRRDEKLAEINLCWQPDLIIVDGRKAFVTGGPQSGHVVTPGLIMASGDPVAIDVEAVRVLLGYKARNKLLLDPWSQPQIQTALRHNLGAPYRDYILKKEPGRLASTTN